MKPMITVFVDERYLAIAANWLAAVRRLGLERQVVLVTLDPEAERALAAVHSPRLFRPLESRGLGDLWIHRVRVLSSLLAEGRDVVHSDADAVWLANPMVDLFPPGFDMVFSQGTIWPPDILAKRGVVACCGLFAVRASPRTCAFFAALERRVAVEHDDQVSINRLLDETMGPWHIESPAHMAVSGASFTISNAMMTAHADDLKVGVLPFRKYPRLMSGPEGVVVGHPLSGKTAAETEETLRKHGLWLVEATPGSTA